MELLEGLKKAILEGEQTLKEAEAEDNVDRWHFNNECKLWLIGVEVSLEGERVRVFLNGYETCSTLEADDALRETSLKDSYLKF